jgi:hypothetical protein
MALFSWNETTVQAPEKDSDMGWCVLGDITIREGNILYLSKGDDGKARVHTYADPVIGLNTGMAYEDISEMFQ